MFFGHYSAADVLPEINNEMVCAEEVDADQRHRGKGEHNARALAHT